jgi:hypothetical protein
MVPGTQCSFISSTLDNKGGAAVIPDFKPSHSFQVVTLAKHRDGSSVPHKYIFSQYEIVEEALTPFLHTILG